MNNKVKPPLSKFMVPSASVAAGLILFVILLRSQMANDVGAGGIVGLISVILMLLGASGSLLFIVTGVRHLLALNRTIILEEKRLIFRRFGVADHVYTVNEISGVSMIPTLEVPTAFVIEFNDNEWFSADHSWIGFEDGLLWLENIGPEQRAVALADFDGFYAIPSWMKKQ